jgi:hypothetical protein
LINIIKIEIIINFVITKLFYIIKIKSYGNKKS